MDINKLKQIKDLALNDTFDYVQAASVLDIEDEEENFTKSNHYRNAGVCLGIVAKIENLLSKIKIVESDTSNKDKELIDKVDKAKATLDKIKNNPVTVQNMNNTKSILLKRENT